MHVHVHSSRNACDYDSVTDKQHVRVARKSSRGGRLLLGQMIYFRGGGDTEAMRLRSPRLLLAPGAVRKRIVGRARGVGGAPARQL